MERNLDYMHYHTYLAKGWPIASGVIEGACRHFVKDRFELSGMRWELCGAENLLRLRSVAENGDWDDYHLFRRQQRHQRLYSSPFPTRNSLEILALELPTSTTPHPQDSDAAESVRNAWIDGEDFELLFTVAPEKQETFEIAWKASQDTAITTIGHVTAEAENIEIEDENGNISPLNEEGYQHF